MLDETVNHVCVLANNQINYKVFSICFLFSFKFFLHLLCISLVPLIFPYPAQILLENALLGRQNARLKNRLLCSKFCRQNLSKPKPPRDFPPRKDGILHPESGCPATPLPLPQSLYGRTLTSQPAKFFGSIDYQISLAMVDSLVVM